MLNIIGSCSRFQETIVNRKHLDFAKNTEYCYIKSNIFTSKRRFAFLSYLFPKSLRMDMPILIFIT